MLKNTKTKKVVSVLVAVAFAFSLFGVLPVNVHQAHADTMMVFTRNLTVGSSGADVSALQMMLVAQGFLVMPAGVDYGYFGGLTKAALGAFQAAHGISPTAGYFGSKTMAYISAHPELMGGASTGGGGSTTCPSGFTCTPVTGVSCPSGYTCLPQNGTGTTTASSGDGTLTVTQGPPGSNSNIQQNVDVPVFGLQLRAQLGDVRVDRVDLDVADTISGGSIENPGNFINNVKIWDGSTVVLNRNLSYSDFVTGTSSTDYYLRLSGVNFLVPNGQTKLLTVSFSTAGSIDTNRNIVIRGYGATSLLYYTGANNTSNYVDISGLIAQQNFSKPGNSTLIVGIDQSNPLSMTNYVDAKVGTQNNPVNLLTFNTNTTQGTTQLTQVVANIRTFGAGTAPTGVTLFQGANRLQYQPVNSTSSTVTFNNLDQFTNGSSGGNVYSIKADFNAAAASGTIASATVTSVTYKNSNGNQQTSSSVVTGNNQYMYGETAQLAFTSADYTKTSNNSGNTTQVQVNFHFTATPYPGQAAKYLSNGADFTIVAISSTGTSVTITNKSLVMSPNPSGNIMAQGQPYTITLTANDIQTTAGTWIYYVTAASSTVQDVNGTYTAVQQTWGFDNWHSDPVARS